MPDVAPTAVVDATAQLGSDVRIGPGCVIGASVVIGDRCELKTNVVICRGVRIGAENRIFANCVLGEEPQIVDECDPQTELIIGDGNVFRENVTINRGSLRDTGKTMIGNNNYFMIGAHLGHDCEVEDGVLVGNYAQIGGHNKIERNAVISALSGTHQFVTIGRFTFAAGSSGMSHDVPPFMRVSGIYPCEVRGLNVIGLRRGCVSEASIKALDSCYRSLYRRRGGEALAQVVEKMLAAGAETTDDNVRYLLEFLQRSSQQRMNRYRELAHRQNRQAVSIEE